jgi:ATP-dependent DNA helicase RecQ
MFYRYEDIVKLDKFNKDKAVTERENAKILLQEMSAYSETGVCRRKFILNYFGEILEKDCGFCDNCKRERETFEGANFLVTVLEAVKQTQERFGIEHLVKVIIGEKDDYVISYQHDSLPVFGKGKEENDKHWTSVIRQAMIAALLEKDIENYGLLKLTPKGERYLEDPYLIELYRDQDFEKLGQSEAEEEQLQTAQAYDEKLFELLKVERKRVAKSKGLPPYVIFQDPSLEEMATVYPTTKEELSQINGVGMGKVAKFGTSFLQVIQNYVAENEIETATEVVIKTSGTRSKVKISIIQQIDRKTSLEEIAQNLNLSLLDLLQEIEQITYSGTKLNIDYYIHRIMDEDREDILLDYFMSAETDHIKAALDELEGEDFTEEELRVYRIKFISEHAN